MSGGYRLWPALALAGLGVLGAGAVVATAAASGPASDCATGQDWVAVTPVTGADAATGSQTVLVDYRQRLQPLFRACVDVSELPALDPADVPDPRS